MSEIKVNSIKGVGASTAAISIDNSSGTCTANITNNLSNRNLIINSAMQISQRSTSAVTIGGGKTVTDVDRFGQWTKTAEGNWKSGQQVEDAPTGFKYSRKITSLAANTVTSSSYHTIRYAVEGFDAAQLNCGFSSAKTVTLSFYVKSSLTGTFGLNFTNSANNRSYPTTYTISSADTWERKTITLTLDTTGTWPTGNAVGLEINWQLAMGSAYISSTLNAWQGGWNFPNTGTNTLLTTNGATFQLTGVQLEVGSVATDFEHRSFAQELALCQRYFVRIQGDNGDRVGIGGYNTGPNEARFNVVFPQTMRSNPTYSGAGTAQFDAADDSADFNLSSVIIDSTPTGFISSVGLQIATSGMTNGQSGGVRFRSDSSSLSFNAEL